MKFQKIKFKYFEVNFLKSDKNLKTYIPGKSTMVVLNTDVQFLLDV